MVLLKMLRLWCLLLVAVTSAVSGDPDLRQLLHIWRPTPALTWSHVTPECAQAMDSFSLALSQRQQWASSMLDATGQSSSQYLEGSNYWLGSRTECEKVNNIEGLSAELYSNDTTMYRAAVYRVLKLKINVSEPLVAPQLVDVTAWYRPRYIWMGVCVPGACGDAAQVNALLRQMLDVAQPENNFRDVQLVHVKILPSNFSIWGEVTTYIFIIFCFTVLCLAMIGTFVDIRGPKTAEGNTSILRSTLLAFSVPRNARSIFTSSSKNKEAFPALNGIRVLTMSWVIYGHFHMYGFIFAENPSYRYNNSNFLLSIIVNGTIAVNTFLFISGFLLAHVILKNKSTSRSNSFWKVIHKFISLVLQRILRLIVPYIFTILLVTITFRQLNADSIFDSDMPDVKNCPQNAWRNLLFINNMYHGSEMCIPWGWYLATDTQLYILGLALLLLYVNGYRRTAILAGVTTLIAASLANAIFTYNIVETLPAIIQQEKIFEHVVSKPWFHVGTVWTGMIVAWFVHRGVAFNVGKVGMIVGWTLFVFGTSSPLFLDDCRESFPTISVALYLAVKTSIWGASLAWVLLNCVHKRSNYVRQFLELPIFAPLGRVTYCTYLLHVPLLEWVFMRLDGPQIINHGLNIILTLGFITASYAFGTVVSIFFESPIIRLLTLYRTSRTVEKYNSANLAEIEPTMKMNERGEL